MADGDRIAAIHRNPAEPRVRSGRIFRPVLTEIWRSIFFCFFFVFFFVSIVFTELLARLFFRSFFFLFFCLNFFWGGGVENGTFMLLLLLLLFIFEKMISFYGQSNWTAPAALSHPIDFTLRLFIYRRVYLFVDGEAFLVVARSVGVTRQSRMFFFLHFSAFARLVFSQPPPPTICLFFFRRLLPIVLFYTVMLFRVWITEKAIAKPGFSSLWRFTLDWPSWIWFSFFLSWCDSRTVPLGFFFVAPAEFSPSTFTHFYPRRT